MQNKPAFIFLILACIAVILAAGCAQQAPSVERPTTVVTTTTPLQTIQTSPMITTTPSAIPTTSLGASSNPYEAQGDLAQILLHCKQGIGTVEDCAKYGIILDRDNSNVISYNETVYMYYLGKV